VGSFQRSLLLNNYEMNSRHGTLQTMMTALAIAAEVLVIIIVRMFSLLILTSHRPCLIQISFGKSVTCHSFSERKILTTGLKIFKVMNSASLQSARDFSMHFIKKKEYCYPFPFYSSSLVFFASMKL
jgi:hypothetical protein